MWPQTYQYLKFFEEQAGYIPLGTLCNHIISIIDQTNAGMSFVVTTYLAF